MTPESVFAKSPKGIEEIETRSHKLGSRLRQVLIRVDGVKTLDELVGEAGDMGEALLGQVEELERQGFLTDTTVAEEAIEAPTAPLVAPQRALPEDAPAPAPRVPAPAAAPKPSPAPPVAAKPAAPKPAPAPTSVAAPAPEAVEFNSPVKFRLQDLLVEALGFETGRVGEALTRCRNRDDLARWVDLAGGPIEQAAGKAKAKAFTKQAKKLVGG